MNPGGPAMKKIHSVAGAAAVSALLAVTVFAAPKRAKTKSTSPSEPLTEAERIKDSGYSGWRLKWANINQIGDRNLCSGINFYSLQRQIAMGKSIAQQVEQSTRLINDPVVVNYINKVGQNLVRNSDAKVPFTFHVVDASAVNAFSLPGGFVFVNSGLILRASNEAELAGVMGHEIAHVDACHGAKQATKADLAQIAMIPLSIMLPYGWAGYGIYEGVNAAVPLAFLKFSRTDEAQADFLGLEYMYKAGYDPNAFISFFEKIEAEERRQPGTISPLFESHPPTPERMLWIQHEIATILPPRSEYLVDTSEFEQVKKRLAADEAGMKLQEKKNAPTLENKSGKKNPKDHPPVLKRRDPTDPNSSGGPQ
jgi:predicted Zn-dependent protease